MKLHRGRHTEERAAHGHGMGIVPLCSGVAALTAAGSALAPRHHFGVRLGTIPARRTFAP